MHSSELAKLAGVTPRTLRHYRSIGLLPEPPRHENGYCDYRMSHLLRLFRIKNLRSLGFSLEKIATMLDELDDPVTLKAPDYLDNLDRDLELQIEQLERQRQTIALLKHNRVGADVPTDFAEFIAQLISENYPHHLYGQERDALLMVDSLLDHENKESVISFYRGLSEGGLMDRYRELGIRSYELTEETPEHTRRELVHDLVDLFDRLARDTESLDADYEPTEIDALLARYEDEELNSAQKDIVRRVVAILENHKQGGAM